MASEKVQIICDSCSASFRVDSKHAGKKLKCKQCGSSMTVPDSQEPDEEQPQKAPHDWKKLAYDYQKEIIRLRKEVVRQESFPKADSVKSTTGDTLHTCLARINREGVLVFVNREFCRCFRVDRNSCLGKKLSDLSDLLQDSLLKILQLPMVEGVLSKSFRDESGVDYEVKSIFQKGYHDVIITDVSSVNAIRSYMHRYVPVEFSAFQEKDLQTFKYPERRYLTVGYSDLKGFTLATGEMEPEEVRAVLNSCFDEVIAAVEDNHATVDKIMGDSVLALYGAPRYFEDHPLRAVKTACEQVLRLKALRGLLAKAGRLVPDVGVGVSTGEVIVGNIGSMTHQDYTVLGSPVGKSIHLAQIAEPGEVLLTEMTFRNLLKCLPKGWERVESIVQPESALQKPEGDKLPLKKSLRGRVILIGNAVKSNTKNAEFRFEYKFSIASKDDGGLLPVLSVRSARETSVVLDDKRLHSSGDGKSLGRYRLIQLIGRGGMGEVWKARDPFGNILAVKTLLSGESASEVQIKRFQREAEIMSRLHHRNICRIHEVGEAGGTAFIAMEFLDGVSLAEMLYWDEEDEGKPPDHFGEEAGDFMPKIEEVRKLRKERRERRKKKSKDEGSNNEDSENAERRLKTYRLLSLENSLDIITGICESIQFAHERGVLHRDLKSANVMLRHDGQPVIMDFGLAKMDSEESVEAMSLSLSGQIVGTIEYMAPEQAQSSKDVGVQADVYSIGAILYQLLTGRKHFNASGNILSDISVLQNYVPPSPKKFNPRIDSDLEVIVLKALRPLQEERYQSVAALLDDLIRYRSGEAISARAVGLGEIIWKAVKRNKALSSVIAASIVMMLTGTAWFMWDLNRSRIEALHQSKIAKAALSKAKRASEEMQKALERVDRERENAQNALKLREEALRESDIMKRLAEKRLEEVRQEQESRRRENREAAPKFYDKALAQVRASQLDDALENLDTAIRFDSSRPEFNLLKGQIFVARKEYEKASREIRHWTDSHPNDAENLKLLNLVNRLSESPNSPFILKDVSRILQRQEHYVLAEKVGAGQGQINELYRSRIESNWPGAVSGSRKDRFEVLPDGTLRLDLSNDTRVNSLLSLQGIPISSLDLSGCPVPSLRGLEEAPLRDLNIAGSDVGSLAMLDSAKLESIDISNTSVDDLSPLAGMPILYFKANHSKVVDYSPLSNTRLKTLEAKSSALSDLSTLDTRGLVSIDLEDCPVVKVDELSNAKGLKSLNLNGTLVANLEALDGIDLELLEIQQTSVSSLGPFEYASLTHLNANNSSVKDISALYRQPLETLLLKNTAVSNIQALKELPIQKLDLSGTQVDDISSLRKGSLRWLNLSNTGVVELAPLQGQKLSYLDLSNTAVSDLRALRSSPLVYLNLSNTAVQDISHLSAMPLKELYLDSTAVSDVYYIRDTPLKTLHLHKTSIRKIRPLSKSFSLRELTLHETLVEDISSLMFLKLESLSLPPLSQIKYDYMKMLRKMESLMYIAPNEKAWQRRMKREEFFRVFDKQAP